MRLAFFAIFVAEPRCRAVPTEVLRIGGLQNGLQPTNEGLGPIAFLSSLPSTMMGKCQDIRDGVNDSQQNLVYSISEIRPSRRLRMYRNSRARNSVGVDYRHGGFRYLWKYISQGTSICSSCWTI